VSADKSIVLSSADRLILKSYKILIDGLANYLGDGYEFVLHSLENTDSSVIKIINGFHTGRKVGAPITDLALSMLAEIENVRDKGYISYRSKNKRGEPLKATTIAIYGDNGRVIGLLCINFYLNTPFADIVASYSLSEPEEKGAITETFFENIDELIKSEVSTAKITAAKDPSILPSQKNKEIISLLYQQGVFTLKDAVIKVADLLGISKSTVYLHVRSINNCKVSEK